MRKKKNFLILIFILILGFLGFNLIYPDFLNLPYFPKVPFKLGLDLQGGTHLIYQIDISKIDQKEIDSTLEGLRDVIERRVNIFGVREPLVQIEKKEGNPRLIVELAGVKDVSEAIKEIGKTPLLEFKEERPKEQTEKILAKRKEIEGKSFQEIQKIENWQLAFQDPYFKRTSLTGKYLKSAKLDFDKTTYEPIVVLEFNKEGAKIFQEITKRNIGKRLAIYIDNVLISAPVVKEEISGGRARITGNFTVQEAKELAQNLSAGALPVPIKLISQKTVGPLLGRVSLEKSLKAGIFGFLAIFIFMILIYRLPGFIASVALIFYVIFTLSLFKIFGVTLTLAGIAGFLLSVGMAVDANILIFSRMREEMKEGKTLSIAIEEGFKRAWPSIRDSNLTTLLVALLLFCLGTGFVKGFGFTLSIGILVSLFSAIFVTKNFLEIFVSPKLETHKRIW